MQCYKCATPIPDNSRFCSTCGADVSGDSHGSGAGATVKIEQADPDLLVKLQAELGTEYILERELGRGGMAIVYLGRDVHLNRKIAVKVLPPELAYAGGSMIERFKREAQTAAKLDHPNIIPVYRVAPGGKLVWYVMKFLEGESLDHVLEREGQLSVERTVDIISQVAAALDYAHQNQVIHRDVKPANIIVDKKGWCTVTDFGIAKALDANTLTASGSIIGTPYYMSPEQCKGKKVGPAADQYSLAVMTYQMLGGHVPFTGDSAVEIVHKHVADPVPPLGVLRAQLPEKVVQVVERGLAKSVDDRFLTVAEYARVLKAVAAGADIVVAPPSKSGQVRISKTAIVSPIPGPMQAAPGPVPPPRSPSRKGVIFGAIGGGLAVAAVAVALMLKPWARPGPGTLAANAGQTTSVRPPVVPVAPPPDTAVPDTPLTTDTPTAPPRSGATTARIVLRNVPNGATVTRDGSPVRGTAFTVTPGRRHIVRVSASGMEPWSDTVAPRAGDVLRLAVSLRAAPTGRDVPLAGRPGTGAVVGDAARPARPEPPPPQPPITPPGTGAATGTPATGTLTVMTRPGSSVFVNNEFVGRTPITNRAVRAGPVTVRFEVTDSTGTRKCQSRSATVTAGQSLAWGVFPLQQLQPCAGN